MASEQLRFPHTIYSQQNTKILLISLHQSHVNEEQVSSSNTSSASACASHKKATSSRRDVGIFWWVVEVSDCMMDQQLASLHHNPAWP